MQNIIRQIRDIMTKHETSDLKIEIYSDDSIVFKIYETEVPIVINIEKKHVYVDCETCSNHLCKDMLFELGGIIEIIEDNIEKIIDIFK